MCATVYMCLHAIDEDKACPLFVYIENDGLSCSGQPLTSVSLCLSYCI